MKTLVLLLIGVLKAGSATAADDLGGLIDKVATAYGGDAALKEAVAVRQTGRVDAATSVGRSGPMVRIFARPLKLRVEICEAAKPKEVRVLDGVKGWRNGKETTGVGYEAMVLQAVRLDLPFQLVSHRQLLVEKEPIDYQGHRVRVVELSLDGGLSITAGIDPASSRILFSTGTTKPGSTGSLTFETRYEDFRLVEGRLFAFKEINFAGETKTADILLEKIEHLKAPPSEAFKP